MQWQDRADIANGYRWVIFCKQFRKINRNVQIIVFINAMFRWSSPVNTCQKSLSVRDISFLANPGWLCSIGSPSFIGGWESVHLARLQRMPKWVLRRQGRSTSGSGKSARPQTVSHSNSTGCPELTPITSLKPLQAFIYTCHVICSVYRCHVNCSVTDGITRKLWPLVRYFWMIQHQHISL